MTEEISVTTEVNEFAADTSAKAPISREALVAYVNKLNQRRANSQERPLDLLYILKRYDEIMERERLYAFKRVHGCYDCPFHSYPRRCFSTRHCRWDDIQVVCNHSNEAINKSAERCECREE